MAEPSIPVPYAAGAGRCSNPDCKVCSAAPLPKPSAPWPSQYQAPLSTYVGRCEVVERYPS